MQCTAATGETFPTWNAYTAWCMRTTPPTPIERFCVVTAPPEHRAYVSLLMQELTFYPRVPDDTRNDLPDLGGWMVRFGHLLEIPTNAVALTMVQEIISLTAAYHGELRPFIGAEIHQMTQVREAAEAAQRRAVQERGFGVYVPRRYAGDSGSTNWTYECSWSGAFSPDLLREACLPEVCAFAAHHLPSRNYHLRYHIPRFALGARRAPSAAQR